MNPKHIITDVSAIGLTLVCTQSGGEQKGTQKIGINIFNFSYDKPLRWHWCGSL